MHCSSCGKALSDKNVSGFCRLHVNVLARRPDVKARAAASLSAYLRANPDVAVQRATRASRARLAWCPPEYRDEYRTLTRSKMLPAAVAREMIESLMAAHFQRYMRTGALQQATHE